MCNRTKEHLLGLLLECIFDQNRVVNELNQLLSEGDKSFSARLAQSLPTYSLANLLSAFNHALLKRMHK